MSQAEQVYQKALQDGYAVFHTKMGQREWGYANRLYRLCEQQKKPRVLAYPMRKLHGQMHYHLEYDLKPIDDRVKLTPQARREVYRILTQMEVLPKTQRRAFIPTGGFYSSSNHIPANVIEEAAQKLWLAVKDAVVPNYDDTEEVIDYVMLRRDDLLGA